MLSNLALIIVVVLTIVIAEFSPLLGLLISIALCAAETAYLYINRACNLD